MKMNDFSLIRLAHSLRWQYINYSFVTETSLITSAYSMCTFLQFDLKNGHTLLTMPSSDPHSIQLCSHRTSILSHENHKNTGNHLWFCS